MGFLKFLKRDKSKEMDISLDEGLDVPPAPPDFAKDDLGKAAGEFPEFPELPEVPEAVESTEFPELKADMPPGKFSEYGVQKEKPLPPLKLPEQEPLGKKFPEEMPMPELNVRGNERFQPVHMPKPGFQAPRPLFPRREHPFPRPIEKPEIAAPKPRIKPSYYQALEKEASRVEAGLRHKKTKGPVYVRIEKFRDMVANTATIKNNLRIASQSIERLNEIDENRDRVFDKWHNVMMDMQKKFIFMDKSVFKKSR